MGGSEFSGIEVDSEYEESGFEGGKDELGSEYVMDSTVEADDDVGDVEMGESAFDRTVE